MSIPDIQAAISSLVDAFERLGVDYYIGGSVASSMYGLARATLDVDIVADLQLKHARPLVHALDREYYVVEDTVRNAIEGRGSFNAIHLETMLKVDVFVVKAGQYDREALSRRRSDTLTEQGGREFYLASPEDVVINKLLWFREGGGVSQRHWADTLGVLQVQGPNLDNEYLRRWAEGLGLLDLLEKAMGESRP